MQYLRDLNQRNRADRASLASTPSVCSAHPQVLLASLLCAQARQRPLLVEATSNQVNQFGGYTGMQAADFIAHVHRICQAHGVDRSLVLFGGDHLGPQVWRDQDAARAMAHAQALVASYVQAGFGKIHLDCSEGCAGEAAQVGDALSAERAAQLAQVCEQAAPDPQSLSYVIGTEVPPPGGARAEDGPVHALATSAHSARETLAAHQQAFAQQGLEPAWARVAGLVVQPGLEFGPDHVQHFDLQAPDLLSPVLAPHPQLAFEAHSTDYQKPPVFAALARRHFTVLKVGPALTFAYRQAVYALDALAAWLAPPGPRAALAQVMEQLMLADPQHWRRHYGGDAQTLRLLRHFSYADRVRYYWAQPAASQAVAQLMQWLAEQPRPLAPLLEQHFSDPVQALAQTLQGHGFDWAQALVLAQVQAALQPYWLVQDAAHAPGP
ncbi:tagatose-6-phosphate kinase [Verminephrobacter aporrectodeae subsp. tuberculatae]|uniref:Tagatose-6-phosphate kinase n=2 Tax=Verminephrobacter TaxID=364316 RepID=A0ABT3KRH4_9BURK|nr:class II D-tagatose-bisphosphate aldolase, non-catalytic subunit [Verminephrobacter aporrectodeae]MCW5320934.1 tagatose-6-phosphate kinase [Verminephrobacter aporrectodeae subsp. tuberculatae]MCW8200674.1 tagatose-6-phosphate kinase [Verminephrobacter aporrectodeae subsp. tuberculatae]